MSKTVALIIAEKTFRDEEYQIPKNILETEGFKVLTVSTTRGKAVGRFGLEVKPDLLLDELRNCEPDALIFVGGGGSSQYFNDLTAHELARSVYTKGKIVGAICIAPVILAKAGLLKGKKATVFPDGQDELRLGGADYTGNQVEADGLLLTGAGPEAAENFALCLVKLLKK